jgi:hypothetical protein
MNRKAVLLAASSQDTPTEYAYSDVDSLSSFLQSNPGGAWDVKEIFQGRDLMRHQILSVVKAASEADYFFLFFAGQGELAKTDRPWREMKMRLISGEIISERDLNSGASRCTLILDCSGGTETYANKLRLVESPNPPEHGFGATDFRSSYERSLEMTETGIVKIYATGPVGPGAQSFTQHLLTESTAWASKESGILHLGEAVALVREAMRRENAEKLPEYQGGRRLRHFPFVVQP